MKKAKVSPKVKQRIAMAAIWTKIAAVWTKVGIPERAAYALRQADRLLELAGQ